MSRRKQAAARARNRGPVPRSQELVEKRDGTWWVRSITGATSEKPYRCPGCQQSIPPATPHLVIWPQEPTTFLVADPLDERRHWHTACWSRTR